jgi:hypothetical protein
METGMEGNGFSLYQTQIPPSRVGKIVSHWHSHPGLSSLIGKINLNVKSPGEMLASMIPESMLTEMKKQPFTEAHIGGYPPQYHERLHGHVGKSSVYDATIHSMADDFEQEMQKVRGNIEAAKRQPEAVLTPSYLDVGLWGNMPNVKNPSIYQPESQMEALFKAKLRPGQREQDRPTTFFQHLFKK